MSYNGQTLSYHKAGVCEEIINSNFSSASESMVVI